MFKSKFSISLLLSVLLASTSFASNASDTDKAMQTKTFSFEDYGLVENSPSALSPTTIVLKFERNRVIDNSFGFYISINKLVYEGNQSPELLHIGYMSGEVIAGDCPTRFSDGIYEKYGKHIRLSHFDIKEGFKNQNYGQHALKQFFAMFNPLGLPYKIEVNQDNHRALYIFGKFGFTKVTDVEGCHFDGICSYMKK